MEASMCLNKQINGSKVPGVGDGQALSASVQCETQPAVRKATSTRGGGGKGRRLKQQCCFLRRFYAHRAQKHLPSCQADTACTQGDKALTVVTLGLRTQQRTPLLLLSAMGSTYIPLFSVHSPSSSPPSSLY